MTLLVLSRLYKFLPRWFECDHISLLLRLAVTAILAIYRYKLHQAPFAKHVWLTLLYTLLAEHFRTILISDTKIVLR